MDFLLGRIYVVGDGVYSRGVGCLAWKRVGFDMVVSYWVALLVGSRYRNGIMGTF